MTKGKFLLSKENKQKINNCVVSYLDTYDISAVQADDDADALVVTTRNRFSKNMRCYSYWGRYRYTCASPTLL